MNIRIYPLKYIDEDCKKKESWWDIFKRKVFEIMDEIGCFRVDYESF